MPSAQRKQAGLLPLALIPGLLLLLLATPSAAASYTPSHGWDVYYDWLPAADLGPVAADLWNQDASIMVTVDPGVTTKYYWSLYNFFTNSTAATAGTDLANGAGAYMGLQTNGDHK